MTLPGGKRIEPPTFRFLGPFIMIRGIVVAIKENLVEGLFPVLLGAAISAFGFAKVKER